MVILRHGEGLLIKVLRNPPSTPAHVAQHNHVICTQESISEPGVHRAQEQPWELPAAPWALGEGLYRKEPAEHTRFSSRQNAFFFFSLLAGLMGNCLQNQKYPLWKSLQEVKMNETAAFFKSHWSGI